MYNDEIKKILGDEDYNYTDKPHQIEKLIFMARWDIWHFMTEALMDRRINADDALKECERYMMGLDNVNILGVEVVAREFIQDGKIALVNPRKETL